MSENDIHWESKLWMLMVDRYVAYAKSFIKWSNWCKSPLNSRDKALCESSRDSVVAEMKRIRKKFPTQKKVFDDIDKELGVWKPVESFL